MTKFEEIGIERQYNSCSKQAAIKAFEKSCDACCKRNMQIDCNKCGINSVHNDLMRAFMIKPGLVNKSILKAF